MPCRYWCSALLVVVVSGCGHSAPLDVTTKAYAHSTRALVQQITFRGYRGKVINGYLAFPRRHGRHPAVLWLHGSGGNDRDFLFSAARWANRGGVGLTISQPNNATSFDPLVGNAERALDLLQARDDVDPHRIAIAGLSLGAETAAIVAGDDKRVHVVALESGRGRPEVLRAVRKSKADFYVQVGLRDEVIPLPQLQALIRAIRGHLVVRWYDLPHVLDETAYNSQLAWLSSELHPSR